MLAMFKKSILIDPLLIYFLINITKSLFFSSSKKDNTRGVTIFNNDLELTVSQG